MTELVRFRVNPHKVRTSIRRSAGGFWTMTIASRSDLVRRVTINGNDIEWIVDRALEVAERLGIPGINRNMEWTYKHPQKS